jgi:hypothetical protein
VTNHLFTSTFFCSRFTEGEKYDLLATEQIAKHLHQTIALILVRAFFTSHLLSLSLSSIQTRSPPVMTALCTLYRTPNNMLVL